MKVKIVAILRSGSHKFISGIFLILIIHVAKIFIIYIYMYTDITLKLINFINKSKK